MTKDVLIIISGLHFGTEEENGEGEPVAIITPAVYYLKNDRHYVLYDEVMGTDMLIAFVCVWAATIIYLASDFIQRKKRQNAAEVE